MWLNKSVLFMNRGQAHLTRPIKDQPSIAIIIRAIKRQNQKTSSDFLRSICAAFQWNWFRARAARIDFLLVNDFDFFKPTTERTVKFRVLLKLFSIVRFHKIWIMHQVIRISIFYVSILPNHHRIILFGSIPKERKNFNWNRTKSELKWWW